MKFKEDKTFDYKLDETTSSIFGSNICEIEWNVSDDGEIIITQFINNSHHTPIMDHEHFYTCNIELYNEIVDYIKKNLYWA